MSGANHNGNRSTKFCQSAGFVALASNSRLKRTILGLGLERGAEFGMMQGASKSSEEETIAMVIKLTPPLAAALSEQARRRGVAPEILALDALRDRFLPNVSPVEPRDDWERRLFGSAIDCGVSVPDSALSSDGLYE